MVHVGIFGDIMKRASREDERVHQATQSGHSQETDGPADGQQ